MNFSRNEIKPALSVNSVDRKSVFRKRQESNPCYYVLGWFQPFINVLFQRCMTENLKVKFPESLDKFRLQTRKHDFTKEQSDKLEEQV